MKSQNGYAVVSRDGLQEAFVSKFLMKVARWIQLGRQRRQLAAMSDFALKDMGLSRADVLQEVEKPFWHDPLKRH